jgi:hypothetical protein
LAGFDAKDPLSYARPSDEKVRVQEESIDYIRAPSGVHERGAPAQSNQNALRDTPPRHNDEAKKLNRIPAKELGYILNPE